MHGRDRDAKLWIFDWLRRVGLEPLEWSDLVDRTGEPAPYNGDAVAAAFEAAQAVVVLFTPDDVGALHPELDGTGHIGESGLTGGQPRLNVVLEAGMALQSHPRKTILVELGQTREISDLAGRNTVRLNASQDSLSELADRLETADCAVRRRGTDWHDVSGLARLTAHERTAPTTRTTRPGGIAVTHQVEADVFRAFRVHEGMLEERVHDGSQWSAWSPIESLPAEAVDLAANSMNVGHAEVFALLDGGEVVHKWWLGDHGWNDEFQSLGRPFGSEPATHITAASMHPGHQEIFVEAGNGTIGHLWHTGGRWHRNDDPRSRLHDGWWRFGPENGERNDEPQQASGR
jgi:hypothetical protein